MHQVTVWMVLAVATLGAGLGACAPDKERIRKDVVRELQPEIERRVRAEVDRRLRLELPRLEARLRERRPGRDPAVVARPRPVPADPAVNPTLDPKRPAPDMAADPALTATPETDARGLVLKRLLIVKKIEQRKPVGEGTSFVVADGQLYCFVEAENPKGPERMLSVAWLRNGKPFHTVRLRVGKGRLWRTWARLRLRPQSVGAWHCTVSNEEGKLVGRAAFAVK